MALHNLTIDVHCQRPTWVFEDVNSQYKNPRYRLYVDDTLLVERIWVWSDAQFIREALVVDLVGGVEHTLTIEPILINPTQAKFNALELKDNSGLKPANYISEIELTFNT